MRSFFCSSTLRLAPTQPCLFFTQKKIPLRLLLAVLSFIITLGFTSTGHTQGILSHENCQKILKKKTVYGTECGFLRLPENPADDASPKIDIYINRIPSIRPSNKPPIFFIAGGPGQASTTLVSQFRHPLSQLLIEHDFIFVDQRGTGRSRPFNCDIDLLALAELSSEEIKAEALQIQNECIKNHDADLHYYTTVEAISDLNKVREKLGYEKIMLWGGSYGSRVALAYIRTYPENSAGAVLDGLAPVQLMIPAFAEEDANRALDKVLTRCENEPTCHKSYPNLRADWLALIQKLKQTPERQHLQHARTAKVYNIYLDHQTLSSWVRLALYSRDVAPLLPLAMYKATQGEYANLFTMITGFENIGDAIFEGMQLTVLCAEDTFLYEQEKPTVDTTYDLLLAMHSPKEFAESCEYLPKGHIPARYFEHNSENNQGEIPTLLLSGVFDPVTPPRWAEYVATSLSNTRHIIAPGGHHIVSQLGCIPKLITAFVKNPNDIHSIDASCVENIKPLPFFIDNAGPNLLSKSTSSELPSIQNIEKPNTQGGNTP